MNPRVDIITFTESDDAVSCDIFYGCDDLRPCALFLYWATATCAARYCDPWRFARPYRYQIGQDPWYTPFS